MTDKPMTDGRREPTASEHRARNERGAERARRRAEEPLPDDDPRFELIQRAELAIRSGRGDLAVEPLSTARELSRERPPDDLAFFAARMLGQVGRLSADLDLAEECYTEAADIAESLHSPGLASAAVEGRALLAVADGRPREAVQLLDESAALAAEAGDGTGRALALNNKGRVLADHGWPGAEEVFREALAVQSLPSNFRGVVLENLARCLLGAGRAEEAVLVSGSAAGEFDRPGYEFDRYKSLGFHAVVLRTLGRAEAAVDAFTAAYDLVHAIRRVDDTARYARHWQRVNEIRMDAEFMHPRECVLADSVGEPMLREGLRLFEAGRYRDAAEQIGAALDLFGRAGLEHRTATAQTALGSLHFETGDFALATGELLESRALARELGDVRTERGALVELARLQASVFHSPLDAMDLLVQARVLLAVQAVMTTRRGQARPVAIAELDVGVTDAMLARLCSQFGAFELAERHLLTSIEVARQTPQFEHRLVFRMCRLHQVYAGSGRRADADRLGAELLSIARGSDHARLRYAAETALARDRLEAGERSAEVLAALVRSADAYDDIREGSLGVGDAAELAGLWEPPLEEAAALAVELGDADQAVHLLERAKARSLLEALAASGVAPPGAGRPTTAAAVRARLAGSPGSALVEFLAGPDRISAITLAADSAAVTAGTTLEPGSAASVELHAATDRLDLSLSGARPWLAGLALLAGDLIGPQLSAEGPRYLVPHGVLHGLPLHLRQTAGGTLDPRPRTYFLPSASVLTMDRRAARTGDRVVVAGDPLGDLVFAELECRAVAARLHATPVLGPDVDADWLARALRPGTRRPRLLHLACHAEFDPYRPDRSGIRLAGGAGTAGGSGQVLELPRLAGLRWEGVTVVLSACSTGQAQVRPGDELAGLARTLLAAGARALVLTLWPVPDLPTYLVMSAWAERLDPAGDFALAGLSEALVAAQRRVRDMPAADLVRLACRWGAESERSADARLALAAARALGAACRAAGDPEESLGWEVLARRIRRGAIPAGIDWSEPLLLARRPAYRATPFSDPASWGAFVVIGAE